MILLMAMARVVVVGPLAKLVGAAKRLEEGRGVKIDVSSNDEVGQLAQALRTMAGAIQVREERINARNRDMRLVLDNVGQGFITLDVSGAMSEERSRIVDDWFGPVEGTPKLWDYLRPFDPTFADNFELGWSAVVDQFLPVAAVPRPAAEHRQEGWADAGAALSPDLPRRLAPGPARPTSWTRRSSSSPTSRCASRASVPSSGSAKP